MPHTNVSALGAASALVKRTSLVLYEEFKSILPKEMHKELSEWWNGIDESEKSTLEYFHEFGEVSDNSLKTSEEMINAEDLVKAEIDDLRDFSNFEFPNQDYYENLIGNEVYLCARGPTFHICKAHHKLRAYLLLGILPKKFNCFIGSENCVMQKQLCSDEAGLWSIKL